MREIEVRWLLHSSGKPWHETEGLSTKGYVVVSIFPSLRKIDWLASRVWNVVVLKSGERVLLIGFPSLSLCVS